MMNATAIPLFENLAQLQDKDRYYDLHNNFTCTKLLYSANTLSLDFIHLSTGECLRLIFTEAVLVSVDFFVTEVQELVLDLLYRGRLVVDGELGDATADGKGYFYLEFYEGQKIEFQARSLILEETMRL